MLSRSWLVLVLLLALLPDLVRAQGGNTCTGAAAAPLSIPFNLNNINLCGSGNDYTGANGCNSGGWGNSYGGQDWFYAFTPTQSGIISITLDDIQTSGTAYPTLSLYEGCPGAPGTCLTTVQGSSWNNAGATIVYSVQSGNQYFIGIDALTISNFYANCYRYDLEATITPVTIEASCSNMGFDAGNLNSWFATTGSAATAASGSPTPNYNINGIGAVNSRHTIMSGGNDPCGGFPRVYPQGSPFSVRLGNNSTGGEAEQLRQNFMVSESNSSFTYRYAVVFEDPGHTSAEQPFFRALLRDQDGNVIPCSEFIVSAAANLPGFFNSGSCPGVRYKPWSTVNVDLSNYLGQPVSVEFTAGDCSQGGHFGYAYIDAACASSTLAALSDTICPGESVTLTAPDGYASYTWQPGNINAQSITVSPTISTIYTLNLSAFNGCNSIYQIPITVEQPPQVSFNWQAPACDLPVQVQAPLLPNGMGIQWDFGNIAQPSSSSQSTVNVIFSGPGTYPVTLALTSAEGCNSQITQNVIVPPCVFRIAITGDTICPGECIDFPVSMAYGEAPYTFSWSTGSSDSSIQVCSNQNQIITLTVTDAEGAVAMDTAMIAVVPDVIFNGQTSNITCFGSNDGSITTNTESWGNLNFLWSTGENYASLGQLSPGSYSLQVVDEYGCLSDTSFQISQPEPIIFNLTSRPAICNQPNGVIEIENISGGTMPYMFSINSAASGTSAIFQGLDIGTYQVVTTDANGCADSLETSIQAVPFPESIILHASHATCGNDNGIIQIDSIDGGLEPFSFSLDGAPGFEISFPFQAEGLNAGIHQILLTDSLGCSIDSTLELMQQFGPTEILFNLTPETCLESNGVVQIDSVVGGTPEFSMDLNGIPILNNLFTDLSPGAYTLNVMDANLCSLDTSFLIESIPPVEVSAIVSQLPTCNGYNNGSADAVISAGMAPFTFLWSQGSSDSIAINLFTGTYSVTASDANGCIDTDTVFVTEPTPIEFNQSLIHPVCGDSNGSIIIDSAWGGTLPYSFSLDTMNWQINNEFNNLGEAIYTTYLRDAQNCLHSSAIELITPSYPVELTTESMDAVCSENNGSISLLGISGGTGQMQVSFNNSDWLNIDSFPFGFTQLDQGAYQIEIIDMNGCRLDTTLSLLRFPGPDEITFEIINATCSLNNSSITVTNINSGTFPFVFHLNDTPSANGVFENLNPGDYSLLITDANGCNSDTLASTIAIEDVSIEIFQLIPVSCAGYSDAVLTAAVETGIQPFSLTWNTGYSGYQQDSLPAGDYSVIVSDANGCLDTAFHSIPDPPQVHIQLNGPEDVCEGESITLNAEAGGGTGHLEIFWPEFNLFGESMSEVPQQSKMYHAEVADANGCTANDSSYLLLRLNPSGSIIPDITEGCSPVCVNLRLESADSSDLTEYLWDFSNLDQSATSTPQYCFEESGMQNISLRITDAFGCSSTLHAENLISVYPVPEARFSFTPNDADVINPLIQFLDESENAATWNWTFSDGGVSVEQNPEHTFPDTGNYSACLKVSSSYGCESFICKSLEISPYPSLFAPNAFTPNGDGTNDIFVVKMKYIDKYFLEIFNRWGELLYETRDQNSGWDGLYMERKCQEDVYVWRVTYTDIQRKSDQIIGRVTLIE